MLRRIVLVASPIITLVSARPAEACSPPREECHMVTAPRMASMTAVPINAPAFFITRGGWSSAAPDGDAGVKEPPTLTSGTTTIALTDEGALHRLTAQPTPGEWTWRYWDECRAQMTTRMVTFGPSAPVPAAMTPFTVSAPKLANVTVGDSGGGCVSSAEAMVADLDITPGGEFGPWSAVIKYTTVVDGTPWASTTYEPSAAEPPPPPGPIQYSAPRRYNRVFSVCSSKYAVSPDRGVAAGTHVIEVQALIAGGAVIKSPLIEVTFTCPSGTTTPDGGTSPTDGGAASAAAPSEGAGCTLGHERASGGAFLVGLLAIATAHARRRERGERTRSTPRTS